MIIRRLTLHNFGVYAGTNTFSFEGDKPIVLIGGLNGRGKTTFLEAVLLCLYGPQSFAYRESKHKTYGQYLRSYVNETDKTLSSYVELEFQMIGDEPDVFVVHRDWNAKGKRIHERVSVKRNQSIDSFLTSNWAMFIENILPSALSNFFFFDGEKIAELAVDSTSNKLRESIRAMLGLTILDQLKKDLQRNLRRIGKDTITKREQDTLDSLRMKKENSERELSLLVDKTSRCTIKLDSIRRQIEETKEEYSAQGGEIVNQRQDLFNKRSIAIAKMDQNHEKLINMAATELPLAMVQDLLIKIERQSKQEYEMMTSAKAADKFRTVFNQYVEDKKNDQTINEFADYVFQALNAENVEAVYSLSEQAMLQIVDLNAGHIVAEIKNTKEGLSDKEHLVKTINEIDSYLSVDVNEAELNKLYKKIKTLEKRQIDEEVLLKDFAKQKASADWEVVKATSEYNKYAEAVLSKMEAQDDADRIMKYSNMSLRILDEYTMRLQKEKTQILALTITECYHKLANKQYMIDSVLMDPATLDIIYVDHKGKEVPKESLSAGEKQLMVIAILWALAICSKKKLPVIIDTPLSRLDGEHRKALIETYFPAASEQTIILSTDSEIDSYYYSMMKDSIGDEFTLHYDDKSRSTSIVKGYFAEDAI